MSFFIGAFLDKLINHHNAISGASIVFIWAIPLIFFLLLLAIHKLKITSKLTIFLFPSSMGALCGLALGGLSLFAEEAMPAFSLMIFGVGIIIGTIAGFLFLYSLDKNTIENEISHKWMLILSIAMPFIFYCIHHVYNYMVFNRVENIAQIVLNLIGTLFGILFLILIRNNSKIWKWKILAIFSVLFSIFIFLGGLGGYLMNERMKQLPDCIGNTTENCIFRDLE
jgi:hypothetical protein